MYNARIGTETGLYQVVDAVKKVLDVPDAEIGRVIDSGDTHEIEVVDPAFPGTPLCSIEYDAGELGESIRDVARTEFELAFVDDEIVEQVVAELSGR